jgi:hypothetical protein
MGEDDGVVVVVVAVPSKEKIGWRGVFRFLFSLRIARDRSMIQGCDVDTEKGSTCDATDRR